MKLIEAGEDAVVRELIKQLRIDERVELGAGDDCAVVRVAKGIQLLKTDCIIEGIHFTSDADPRWIGWKALCRAASDIGAMGGEPKDALVTLAANPQAELDWLKNIYRGLRRAADIYQINLVGGETARSPGPLFISVALTGKTERGRYATRSGGQPGDCLYVTGELGGSLKGKHLKFRPRVYEGMWLVRHFPIRAMMDLSDGLASDLPRLANSSRVGFEIDLDKLPVTRGCNVQNALQDGEDYELLFAVPLQVRARLETEWPHSFPKLTCIGRLVEAGKPTQLGKGYNHFGSSQS